jgi:hypothetical protein
MKHTIAPDDFEYLQLFTNCGVAPAQFHHRDHLRLGYIFLIRQGADHAYEAIREALQTFLAHHDIDPAKYHVTLTRAWLLAVQHFMELSPPATSADEFIRNNPRLLDPSIMLTHYSKDLIRSDRARAAFVEPDIQQIPRH